jgi:hypothetical protein
MALGFQRPASEKVRTDRIKERADANQLASPKAAPIKTGAANDHQEQGGKEGAPGSEESVRIVSVPRIFTESQKDTYDKTLVICTVLLVVVGAFQILYLWRTVNATRDNAKAALLNAQAVINTERPWLVVTWASDRNTPGLCRFGCRNQGNTPAKVVSMSAKSSFIDKLDNLPVPPDYSSPVTMPDLRLIVHEDNFSVGQGIHPESIIRNAGKKDLADDSREFLVYYGNVVYRDTFYPDSSPNGLHETRWCFVYQPAGERRLVRSGPEAYNRYT